MFFHVTAAFAEFERDMIRSRVNAGLARARARGVRLGRPKTSAKVERTIRTRLAAGAGILKTARALGVGAADQGDFGVIADRGVRTARGSVWHNSTVRNLLTRA